MSNPTVPTPDSPFPVVTTWEEAKKLLDRGCGVGIDATKLSQAEQEYLQMKIDEYLKTIGIRPQSTGKG